MSDEYSGGYVNALRRRITELESANETLISKAAENEKVFLEATANWGDERVRLEAEVSRLQVQLAGCGVAAMGGTEDPAKQGDYGWSAAYQSVLELRIRYDAEIARKGLPKRNNETLTIP